LLNQWEAVK